MKNKIYRLLFIIPVLLLIYILPSLTALSFIDGSPIKAQPQFDEIEYRMLADVPVYSREALWSGEYSKSWELFLSERFLGRNNWLKANTLVQRSAGRAWVNDVIEGEDYLIPRLEDWFDYGFDSAANTDIVVQRLKAINDLVKSYGGEFIYVVVPRQCSFYEALYPSWQMSPADYRDRTKPPVSGGTSLTGY